MSCFRSLGRLCEFHIFGSLEVYSASAEVLEHNGINIIVKYLEESWRLQSSNSSNYSFGEDADIDGLRVPGVLDPHLEADGEDF